MSFLKGTVVSLVLFTFSHPLFADSLQYEDVKATPTFALAKMGAVYGSFKNVSDTPLLITGLQVDAEIAASVELHESYIKDDMASMKQLNLPFTLAPQQELALRRGGKHIMLIGLQQPLTSGMQFQLTFSLQDQEAITVPVVVSEAVQQDSAEHKHHH